MSAQKRKPAALAMEDGTFMEGWAFGAEGERSGELCFNTSMTGYQEVLTDPSYKGQIVVMTYPHIGSYGITEEDMESRKPFLEGFVVHEAVREPSNWQAKWTLPEYLSKEGVVSMEGADTRWLTRRLRDKGAMRAVVSSKDVDRKSLVRKAKSVPSIIGADMVGAVTAPEGYDWDGPGRIRVVAMDFGIKRGMLRCLAEAGASVRVVPARTTAEEILALRPDGVLLSNGPGDPEPLTYAIGTIKRLLDARMPTFGICLGHQLLGLALGGKSYKLKFGHRGANHPVQEAATGRILVTTHNHGFAIDAGSLPRDVRPTYKSLNDGTLEGFEHQQLPVFAVQFHPEASAGPHDAKAAFEKFSEMTRQRQGAR
jgi:carbamoyl-phosphate synthase small subunit